MRSDHRTSAQLRPVTIEYDVQPRAAGSVLIKMGGTHVVCGVSLEEKVPPFLQKSGQGWLTAEYGMLPCATTGRTKREAASGRSGRTFEIQRLIGRSLRMMLDLRELGERTLRIDCDVLNADGGTRCAAITGAALAVAHALDKLHRTEQLPVLPALLPLAAISAGIVDGTPLLDLSYAEDSRAQVDANFVMTGDGRWVEVQSSAEGAPFAPELFSALAELARQGIGQLLELWPAQLRTTGPHPAQSDVQAISRDTK